MTVELLREPGGVALSERLREVVKDPALTVSPRAEALVYAAARAQLVEEKLRPLLDAGTWVLLDRFVDSSLAYQGGGRGLGIEAVAELNRFGTGGLDAGPHALPAARPARGARAPGRARGGGRPARARGRGLLRRDRAELRGPRRARARAHPRDRRRAGARGRARRRDRRAGGPAGASAPEAHEVAELGPAERQAPAGLRHRVAPALQPARVPAAHAPEHEHDQDEQQQRAEGDERDRLPGDAAGVVGLRGRGRAAGGDDAPPPAPPAVAVVASSSGRAPARPAPSSRRAAPGAAVPTCGSTACGSACPSRASPLVVGDCAAARP